MSTVVGTPPGVTASHYTKLPPPTLPVTSGLLLHLDAADASTFTYSAGVAVQQWRDKSPNGLHFTYSGGTRANHNGIQNGWPCLVVPDDTTAYDRAVISTAIDNFAIFVASKRSGGPVAGIPFINGNGSINGIGVASRANAAFYGFLLGGVAWHTSTTPETGAASVHTVARTAGVWGHYVNGLSTSLNGMSGNAPQPATTITAVPDAILNHEFVGSIFEIVYYNTALSGTDRSQVETYLRTKWGVV